MYNIVLRLFLHTFHLVNLFIVWIREKYDASTTHNPIRDALKNSGTNTFPYDLDGGYMLNTLCPNKTAASLKTTTTLGKITHHTNIFNNISGNIIFHCQGIWYIKHKHKFIHTLGSSKIVDEPCDGGLRNETRECCSREKPCKEGQGDCDDDDECKGDLVCGSNNCGKKFRWHSADCCEKKGNIE